MKSKLFKKNSVLGNEFEEDISKILNIDLSGILTIFPGALRSYLVAQDSKTETIAIEGLREKLKVTLAEFNSLINIGGFFYKRIDRDDSIDDIMDDLESIISIEAEKKSRLRDFITAVNKEAMSFELERLSNSTQRVGIERIKAIAHAIDLRAVISNSPDINDNIKDYQPDVATLVPVSILKIRLSNDKTFMFQMDEFAFNILKDELLQIEKEMAEVLAYIEKGDVKVFNR